MKSDKATILYLKHLKRMRYAGCRKQCRGLGPPECETCNQIRQAFNETEGLGKSEESAEPGGLPIEPASHNGRTETA